MPELVSSRDSPPKPSPWEGVVELLLPVMADTKASRTDRVAAAEIVFSILKQKA